MRNLYIRTVRKSPPKQEPRSTSKFHRRETHMQRIRKEIKCVPLIKYSITLNQKRLSQVSKQSSGKSQLQQIDEMGGGSVVTNFELFEEKYEFQEKLGEGASGVVHKCIKKQTGQEFAVKSVVLETEQIPEIKKNFLTMKRLKHPNILNFEALMVDIKKRTGWLVMELVKAQPLLKAGLKTEEEIKSAIFQIIGALHYLHRQDIAHRDIKPDNILYDKQTGKIKLIDFGISKRYRRRGTLFDMWTITGTLYYRAPEAFCGGYRQRVDIWSTGILLYKIITGITPFQSEYHHKTIQNIANGSIDFPPVFDNYSIQLKTFLLKMLERDPERRSSSYDCLKDVWLSPLSASIVNRKVTMPLTGKDSRFINEGIMYTPNVANVTMDFNTDLQDFLQGKKKQLKEVRPYIRSVNGQEYHVIDSEWEPQKLS